MKRFWRIRETHSNKPQRMRTDIPERNAVPEISMRVNNILSASLRNGALKAAIALLTVCAVAQQVDAQSAAKRQVFPWSSSSSVETTPSHRAVSNSHPTPAVNYSSSTRNGLANAVSDFERQITVDGQTLTAQVIDGEVVYMDAATVSSWTNSSPHQPVQATQSTVQHQQAAATSAWGKAKNVTSNVTSKATSIFKKPLTLKLPSLNPFKKPEGLTLPSASTAWGKPKFSQPTSWFSHSVESDITFAPLNSLPNTGQLPTSIDATRSSIAAGVRQHVDIASEYAQEIGSHHSVWEAASERTASNTSAPGDNTFDPRR